MIQQYGPQHEALGNKPNKLCSYSPEPRAEVYCLKVSLVLICGCPTWDMAAGTAWDNAAAYVSIYLSQALSEVELSSTSLHRQAGAVCAQCLPGFGLNSYIWKFAYNREQ